MDLDLSLKCPHKDVDQSIHCMVFSLVAIPGDYPGSHSFTYGETQDSQELALAYDLTYSLNPELNIKTKSRALSVNGKRTGIDINDLATIAEKYTIKHFKRAISEIQEAVDFWSRTANVHDIPARITETILKNFSFFS